LLSYSYRRTRRTCCCSYRLVSCLLCISSPFPSPVQVYRTSYHALFDTSSNMPLCAYVLALSSCTLSWFITISTALGKRDNPSCPEEGGSPLVREAVSEIGLPLLKTCSRRARVRVSSHRAKARTKGMLCVSCECDCHAWGSALTRSRASNQNVIGYHDRQLDEKATRCIRAL
jgi:hypothetical protein